MIDIYLLGGSLVKDNNDEITYLMDSTSLFDDIRSISLSGSIEYEDSYLSYNSISEGEFMNVLSRNIQDICYFDNKVKFNEKHNDFTSRDDSVLTLYNNEGDSLKLVDVFYLENWQYDRFFLSDITNNFFIVKWISRSDAGVNLYNRKTLELEKTFIALHLYYSSSNEEIIYSHPSGYLEVYNSQLKRSSFVPNYWKSNFCFYDKKTKWWYYIHRFSMNGEIYATFAKMNVLSCP